MESNALESNALEGNAHKRSVTVLKEQVLTKYDSDLHDEMLRLWSSALQKGRKREREHFLKVCGRINGEAAPQVEGIKTTVEEDDEDLQSLLYKLLLYAPESWYKIVTSKEWQEAQGRMDDGNKNDWKHIGVAFDASSRLRRAGIDFYHHRLTEMLRGSAEPTARCYYIPSKGDASSGGLRRIPRGSTKDETPVLPDKRFGECRVVAISDTHLFHSEIQVPRGDVLVHAGDLSYEESRSRDAKTFETYKASGGALQGKAFYKWFQTSGLGLHDALSWLSSRLGFQHKVLVGGNHDFILEQLGARNAEELCRHYGITYLHTERAPVEVALQCGGSLRFWGSGLSVVAQVGATRAVKSGNNAFQTSEDEADELAGRAVKRLKGKPLDVMVVHAPPATGDLLGKKGERDPVGKLISEVQPGLFICGHAHRPDDPLKGIHAMIKDTLCINAACLGVWNQLHGYPVVVDLTIERQADAGQTCGVQ